MIPDLKIIEKLIVNDCCPACVCGEESRKTYMRWFDVENYGSINTMVSISKNGLCRKHGWELTACGNKLSSLNQFVIKNKIIQLEKSKAYFHSHQKKPVLYRIWPFSLMFLRLTQNRLHSTAGKCPICMAVEQGETLALHLTAALIKNEKGLAVYNDHPSLCWVHLVRLLDEIPREPALSLIQTHIAHLKKMDEDLDEYSRKTDYRYSHEPKGEEQLAWLKSLRFYVGESFDTYK